MFRRRGVRMERIYIVFLGIRFVMAICRGYLTLVPRQQ